MSSLTIQIRLIILTFNAKNIEKRVPKYFYILCGHYKPLFAYIYMKRIKKKIQKYACFYKVLRDSMRYPLRAQVRIPEQTKIFKLIFFS